MSLEAELLCVAGLFLQALEEVDLQTYMLRTAIVEIMLIRVAMMLV